jgi:hypothetical protein
VLEQRYARKLFIKRLIDEGYIQTSYGWLIKHASTVADWIDDCLWFELADGIEYVKNGTIYLNFSEFGINVTVQEEIGESELVKLIPWEELNFYDVKELRRTLL